MRLIDADTLEPSEVYMDYGFTRIVYMDDIDEMPTIDAVPVRHGRWIKQKYEDTDGSTIYGWECSVCGEGVVWRTDDDINIEKFCYDCGAKMDLDEVNK